MVHCARTILALAIVLFGFTLVSPWGWAAEQESATYQAGNGPIVKHIVKCSMYFVLLMLAPAAISWAQSADTNASVQIDDERHIKLVRTDNPPTLDGVLDDPCWAEAGKTSALFNERTFALCTEQTTIYTTYDSENLYVAFECLESDMSSLQANEYRDDRIQIRQDDHVQIRLDTFHDHRNSYVFYTNPVGACLDSRQGLVRDRRGWGQIGWDCNWKVATSLADDRWFVEMIIPLSELLFERKDNQTWGVNFMRKEQRLQEKGYWSLRKDDQDHARNFGHLEGLDLADAAGQRKLWLSPYVSGLFESNSTQEFDGNIGLDATYKVTSDLKAVFTVNPDFGQVEADTDDMILRDIERRLPERRPFFEEGLELFATPLSNLFYSRRIIDIDYGAKLSGKAGPYSLALLDIEGRIDREDQHVSGNFAAARVIRDIGEESILGVLATSSERKDGYNRVAAVDGRFRLPYDVDFSAQYATSWIDDDVESTPDDIEYDDSADDDEITARGTEQAYIFKVSHGQEPLWIWGEYIDIGKDFRPDLSFVSRRDIKGGRAGLRYFDDTEGAWYHQANAYVTTEFFQNHDERTVLRDYTMTSSVIMENGFGFGIKGAKDFHDPHDNYNVGITLEANALDAWHKARLTLGTGEFEETRYNSIGLRKGYTPLKRFTLSLDSELRREDLHEGHDNVWLTSAVGNYSITNDMWLKGFIQFRDQRQHNANIIFKWELFDRQIEWYLVYNDVQISDDSPYRSVFTKVVYNF